MATGEYAQSAPSIAIEPDDWQSLIVVFSHLGAHEVTVPASLGEHVSGDTTVTISRSGNNPVNIKVRHGNSLPWVQRVIGIRKR